MQKSKIATIGFIIGIVIYIVLRVIFLDKLGTIYTYLINPLFWIILALSIYKLFGKNYENKKFGKQIIDYTLIACLVYIITYLISGLFVTFGDNPYSQTIKGIIINIWSFGTVLVAKEYIRYRLINNVREKDKKTIFILVTILFTLIDLQIWKRFGEETSVYFIFMLIFKYCVPVFARNIL